MAAKDLATLNRVKQHLSNIVDNSMDPFISVLITTASDGIEKYCRRHFYSRFYDELYSGDGNRHFFSASIPFSLFRV